MSTIANLDVNLFANTAKFDAPLKKSGESFNLFSGVLDKGISRIPSIATIATGALAGMTAGIGVGVASATVLASKIASLNSEVREFERFGLSAEKSFGQFKILASDAGLELEDFADLAKDLGVRIGEANIDGEGEIFNIFKKLGLDVKELAGLAPEQQLEAYADAISKVENETERLAITDILLSDAGTKALGVLEKGTAGFTSAAQEAEKFGLNVSAVDTAQLESARQSMSRIGLLAEGLFNTIAIKGAPTIQALSDMIIGAAGEMGGFSSVAEVGFEIVNAGIGFVLDGWNLFIGGLKIGAGFLGDQFSFILSSLALVEEALVKLGGEQFDFGIKGLGDEVVRLSEQFAEGGIEQLNSGLSGDASREFQERIKEIKRQAEESAIPKIEPPKPFTVPEVEPELDFDFSKIVKSFNKAGQDEARRLKEGNETASERPSVSSLAFGSASTQSFLNQLGQQSTDKQIQQQLKEAKRQEKELFERNIQQIKSVATAIGRATGIVVPF